ncbi:MAG: TRAP transporter large permease subunit [Roseiflexus sp.]|nr:TRAP transporter large permease subunit [Roseiflexus sp.]MCS7288579.1 TRAP transporter large permease subunit [Roseiflexus sp.]MDW8145282.1 TRAP transporter large permease subunit [Roseiflexaceae bacterium]MDW8232040.1 TRAP transporter large permease subunit [Roseiflexaceae bacterium]
MGYEWLAIAMFVGFFFLLISGYPVAFSFAGTAIVFGLIGLLLDAVKIDLLRLLPNRWFGTMSDFTLLAIPFFIYLGSVLERSGLAEELLETVGILLGPLRGGIALAVVMVGTLLAATTGVVAATIIAMGLISLPIMVRLGYDKGLATGAITSSGTLAQMIPPSLVLVVLSDQIGVSVGDLFAGALIPGLMLAGSYALYCLVIAYLKPELAPPLPLEMRQIRGRALLIRTLRALVPPIALIFAVLGSIFFGLATPTEAGSVGAVGAILLAWANKRLSWKLLADSALSTARTSTLVIMILFCSTFFSLIFEALGGTKFVTELLTGLPGGILAFIIVSNIVVFLLGIFLEFVEICFIVMPLFVPAANELGIDMVWFGIMMAVNLQTAFVSPPVGFSLFYLQSVAPPEVETADIHKGALPFIALQIVVLILVILFPGTVTWLVERVQG